MKAKILLLQVLLVVAIVLTGCKKEPEEFDVLCSVSATQDFSITLSVGGSTILSNFKGSGYWSKTVSAQESTQIILSGSTRPILSTTASITLKIKRGVITLEEATITDGLTQISHTF